MLKSIVTAIVLFGATSVHAALTDTRAESEAKYGRPFLSKGNLEYYKKKGYVVCEWFNSSGQAEVIAYYKLNGTISQEESNRLCWANLPAGIDRDSWIEIQCSDPGCRFWETVDGAWAYESGVVPFGPSSVNLYSCLLVGTVNGIKQMNSEDPGNIDRLPTKGYQEL